MIVRCQCWCYIDPITESGNQWLPYAFCLSGLTAIKLCTDVRDHFAYGMARIYAIGGAEATVNIPFEKLLVMWEDFYNKPRIDFSKQ